MRGGVDLLERYLYADVPVHTDDEAYEQDLLSVNLKDKLGSANRTKFFEVGPDNFDTIINKPSTWKSDENHFGVKEVIYFDNSPRVGVKLTEFYPNAGKQYYRFYNYTNDWINEKYGDWFEVSNDITYDRVKVIQIPNLSNALKFNFNANVIFVPINHQLCDIHMQLMLSYRSYDESTTYTVIDMNQLKTALGLSTLLWNHGQSVYKRIDDNISRVNSSYGDGGTDGVLMGFHLTDRGEVGRFFNYSEKEDVIEGFGGLKLTELANHNAFNVGGVYQVDIYRALYSFTN